MEEQKILEAIERLRSDIGGRLDSIEQRLGSSERQQAAISKRQDKQDKDIDTLFERLDELCERKPIWKSRDRREVAVSRDDAYDLFKALGFSRLEAMRIIDKAGRLSREKNDSHLAKAVRSPKVGRTRAVVIFMEDE